MSAAHLHTAARLIASAADWRWLALLKARLATRAKPEDRFNRLVPGWHTLDLGIEMMDEAATLPLSRKQQDLHYRDGLILALLSLWLILPYVVSFLEEVRPRLLGRNVHDGLWPSAKGCPLSAGRIYDIVRARVTAKFGKAIGLHDFRRAAATFIATDAPQLIGLVPGVLQHASPEVGEQHYNLARSLEASRRYAAYVARTRARLRPAQGTMES